MEPTPPQVPYPQKPGRGNTTLEQLLIQKCVWKAEQANAHHHASSHSDLPNSPTHHRRASPAGNIPFNIPAIDELLPGGGLPRNAIHEIFYRDPLLPKALASTLSTIIAHNAWSTTLSTSENASWHTTNSSRNLFPSILWIGSECWPCPLALSSYGSTDHVSFIQQCIFIAPPNSSTTLWAVETALRSRATQIIIAACPSISRPTTQRLSIAAYANKSTAILLRKINDLHLPSHAHSRWELTPTPSPHELPSWELTLHKFKGHALQKKTWCISLQDLLPYSRGGNKDTLPIIAQAHDRLSFATSEPVTNRLIASHR